MDHWELQNNIQKIVRKSKDYAFGLADYINQLVVELQEEFEEEVEILERDLMNAEKRARSL